MKCKLLSLLFVYCRLVVVHITLSHVKIAVRIARGKRQLCKFYLRIVYVAYDFKF